MITPQQAVSRKQEKRTAATYGGTVQPGSGSGWVHRNDVRSSEHGLLIENKTKVNPTAKSISIKAKDLEGLRTNALRKRLIGVLQFDLNTRQYVILTEDDFLGYLDHRCPAERTSDSNGCSSSSRARRREHSSTGGSAMERLASAASSSPKVTMMLRALQHKLSATGTSTAGTSRVR